MAESWKKGGLKPDKYIIFKDTGEPVDPEAKYFVLRYDSDPHAVVALRAYAESVARENPEFANDILQEINARASRPADLAKKQEEEL